MNWPIRRRERRTGKSRARLSLPVVVVSTTLTALTLGGPPAHADTTGTTQPCSSEVNTSNFAPGCLPPALLTLSGLYTASPDQASSLLDLEYQAVTNTIEDHGLSGDDGSRVLSWARPDAEAELFALIVQAIDTPAALQTPDQQNAVAWVQAVEQRQAEVAAQDAGLEYVEWAGLDPETYSSLIAANASESDLQSFLSGSPPSPYGPGGSSGYCTFQPPNPDQSEYTPPTDCSTGAGLAGTFGGPPAPSYDQFLAWGETDAAYSLQSSTNTVQEGAEIAAGLDFGAAAAGAAVAGVALGAGFASTAVGAALASAILPFAGAEVETIAEVTTITSVDSSILASELAASVGAIAGAVIFAVTNAVIEGINVANAAALPGQLAGAIVNAQTTAPDVSTLISGASGASSLFSLFVGATLPVPLDDTCDNDSSIPPGLTVISGTVTGAPPDCLNPTAIPPANSSDPQFVVQEKGGTASSTTSSITWRVPGLGTSTATARLSGNWFVIQANGSDVGQTLGIAYTDWNGNEQIAWLVGNPAAGYQFVGYNATAGASTGVDPSTCVADGTCWASPSIDYVGGDGNDYSAQVQAPAVVPNGGTVSGDNPTGSPTVGNAVEGSPVEFDATTFGPLADFNAQGVITSPVTYTWQVQAAVCNLGCLSTNGVGPAYGPPITGGIINYTFPTSGTYSVILTATDADNNQAVDTFNVDVADVPPTLRLGPGTRVPVGSPTSLAGTITQAGTGDIENVYVDWGDGSTTDSGECGLPPFPLSPDCDPGFAAVPGAIGQTNGGALALTSANNTRIAFSDSHTYATAGVYYASVTVTDQSGATVSQTVVEAVIDPAPAITSLAPQSVPTGSSATVTITGSGLVPGSTVEWNGTPLTTTYVPSLYVSPQLGPTLTAQLPATDTASAAAGLVTVVNRAPGGGTSNPEVIYVVPPQSAIAASTLATSTSASGSASASVGGSGAGTAGSLSAVANGSGTVALAQYSSDPVTTTPPTAVNAYFDVFAPASSSFGTVQVTDCDLAGGSVVYYYNDTTSQWTEVSGQTYNAGTGCVTFTLGTASTPNLTELSGTEFGVQDVLPSLRVPANQNVPYHGAVSLSVSATDTQPNALTLSSSGLPTGLSFTDNGNGTGTVTGTVTAAPGNYPVTFTASDGTVSTTSPPITITVTTAGTTLTYTGASLIANNRPATLSAVLEEKGGSPPVPDGQTVTLTLGSGSSAQSCQGQTQADGWVSCQIATVDQPLGNQPVSATFSGDTYYSASAATGQQSLVFSYLPAGGGFALGDQTVDSATPTTTLTWWGSKWSKSNSLSGGTAPASFKGFAQTFVSGPTTVTDPACGGTWTGSTGGGANLPNSVPAYMALVVPSKITQSGSTISGNVAEVVIVKTNAGYQPDPSDPGTGTVVATLCAS
jgi:hypothetical protein